MDLNDFFGKQLMQALISIRNCEEVVEYIKIGKDEFLKILEKGYYLQSKNGSGIITDFRIFFQPSDGFLSSPIHMRGRYADATSFDDIENILGKPVREIPSIRIHNISLTLAGREYFDHESIISAHSSDGYNIDFLHIKSRKI